MYGGFINLECYSSLLEAVYKNEKLCFKRLPNIYDNMVYNLKFKVVSGVQNHTILLRFLFDTILTIFIMIFKVLMIFVIVLDMPNVTG